MIRCLQGRTCVATMPQNCKWEPCRPDTKCEGKQVCYYMFFNLFVKRHTAIVYLFNLVTKQLPEYSTWVPAQSLKVHERVTGVLLHQYQLYVPKQTGMYRNDFKQN